MVPQLSNKLELTHEQFTAWWEQLTEEDRQEFMNIYGGDEYSARFVCALDFLTLQKIPFPQPEDMFVSAYWLSAVYFEPYLKIDSPGLRNRAIRAWKSDAVQALFDRVRYRSVRQGSIRLQNKLFALGEAMADSALNPDAGFKQQKAAADALVRIVQLVDLQEQTVRAERTKRGLERAREALAGKTSEVLTERELGVMLRAASKQLGEEKVLALMKGSEE